MKWSVVRIALLVQVTIVNRTLFSDESSSTEADVVVVGGVNTNLLCPRNHNHNAATLGAFVFDFPVDPFSSLVVSSF